VVDAKQGKLPEGEEMTYEIKILKEETFRSKPLVNMTDDMVRVTFVCSRNDWHEIKREWRDNNDLRN